MSMTSIPCPLPQVEEALAPYIHTRQETRRIREAIAAHLSRPIESGIPPSLQLACPDPNAKITEEPSSLDGLYKRYYDALYANTVARQRYAALKQELAEAREQHIVSNNKTKDEKRHGSISHRSSVQNHIELQRRRRQHNKLQIIQETMERIKEQAPRALDGELGSLLKEQLGEGPDPPQRSLGGGSSGAHLDDLIFKLKRELLLAKNGMDQANRAKSELHEQSKSMQQQEEPSVEAQVYALRGARDQLISWIEEELAKMPDEGDSSVMEPEAESGSGDAKDLALPSPEETTRQIQELYEQYVAARKRFVITMDAATAATKRDGGEASGAAEKPSVTSRSTASPGDAEGLRYSDLMTYVPGLVQAARTERSLIQQVSYLRRQLASASEDTRTVIQRLAGESYLVPPDATSMDAWAKAAAAKNDETDAFVREQLAAGRQCLESTNENLGKAEARRKAAEQLRGDL